MSPTATKPNPAWWQCITNSKPAATPQSFWSPPKCGPALALLHLHHELLCCNNHKIILHISGSYTKTLYFLHYHVNALNKRGTFLRERCQY